MTWGQENFECTSAVFVARLAWIKVRLTPRSYACVCVSENVGFFSFSFQAISCREKLVSGGKLSDFMTFSKGKQKILKDVFLSRCGCFSKLGLSVVVISIFHHISIMCPHPSVRLNRIYAEKWQKSPRFESKSQKPCIFPSCKKESYGLFVSFLK